MATIWQYVGQLLNMGGAKITNLGTPTASSDAVTKAYADALGGGATNPTIYYTGSAWPARTTVTVPSGGHVIYNSEAYPSAPQPSDWTGTDEWNFAVFIPPSFGAKQIAWFTPINGATTATAFGTALNVTGTAAAGSVISNGTAQTKRRRLLAAVTTAATSAVAGWRENTLQWTTGGGFIFQMRGAMATGAAAGAARRFFMGMASTVAVATDAVFNTALTDGIGVIAETGDTNLFLTYRTGSSTAVRVDTGFAKNVADNTEMYDLTMVCAPGGTTIQFTLVRLSDGSIFTHTSTTAIPATNTLLTWRLQASVGGVSSVISVALANLYLENASA